METSLGDSFTSQHLWLLHCLYQTTVVLQPITGCKTTNTNMWQIPAEMSTICLSSIGPPLAADLPSHSIQSVHSSLFGGQLDLLTYCDAALCEPASDSSLPVIDNQDSTTVKKNMLHLFEFNQHLTFSTKVEDLERQTHTANYSRL